MTAPPVGRRYGVALFLLLVVAAALYAPQLGHPFLWDDGVQIKDNPAVKRGVPLGQYFTDRETTSTRPDYNDRIYRPLRNVGLRQVWRVSDLAPAHRPAVFLGTNLVLFLVGGLLVFALSRRFTQGLLGPLLATGMWLLVPVHCEDVLYASAFGDLLSCDLQLCSMLFLVGAFDTSCAHRRRDAIAALVFYVLATLAKEMAITQVLLVAAYVVSERRELLRVPAERRRAIAIFSAHVVATVVYLAVRVSLLRRVGQEPVTVRSVERGLAECGWLLMRYLSSAVAPLGHAPDYGVHNPGPLWCVLGWLGVMALLALAAVRSRSGMRFGSWMFVLCLVPVLRLVPLWTLMADRFALVPTVGLALVLAGAIDEQPPRRAMLVTALSLVGFLLWGAGIAIESRHFHSDETLWTYSVDQYPDSPLAQHNLGLLQMESGKPDIGLVHLLEAERMGRGIPRLYFHLALTFDLLHRPAEAFNSLDEALRLDPKYVVAHAMRAQMLRRGGDLDAASRELDVAAALDPNESTVIAERGALFAARGDDLRALELYRIAANDGNESPAAWGKLAATALKLGRVDEARDAVRTCLSISTDFPGCRRVEAALPR